MSKIITIMCICFLFISITTNAQDKNSNKLKIKKVTMACSSQKGELPFSGDATFSKDSIYLELYANGTKSEVFINLDSLVKKVNVVGTVLYQYKASIKLNIENTQAEQSDVFIQDFSNKKILKINSPFEQNCVLDIEFKIKGKK
jgi:hypothetical protein